MSMPSVRMSERIGEFAEAFAKAQAAMTNPGRNRPVEVKTKDGGKYGFAYATFDAILEVARPALAANGIGYVQAPVFDGRELVLMTTLIHASGQWLEVPMPIIGQWSNPQAFGSALTYAKRYGFCAAVGIAPQEDDDDGAAAAGSQIRDARTASSGRATQPARGPAVPPEGQKRDPAPSAPERDQAEPGRGKPADPNVDLYTLYWPPDEKGHRFTRTFERSGSGIVDLLGAMAGAVGSTAPKMLAEPENRMMIDQIRAWAAESPKRSKLIEKIAEIEDLAANPPGAV